MLSEATEEFALNGWRIRPGFAACAPAGAERHFYAVYGGEAFNHEERGIIAVMARSHPEGGRRDVGATGNAAAQLVVHSFVEGYFGAPRTLGPKRAASLSLNSINGWLFSQLRNDRSGHLAPVSVTAALFCGPRLGIAHIGACRLYRCRAGKIAPLVRDHSRPAHENAAPARAIGLDLEMSVDYAEEPVEVGDRYLLVSGLEVEHGQALSAAFALDVNAVCGAAGGVSLMLLDVLACPAPEAAASHAALADLPIRPAPREGDVWDGFVIGKTLYKGRYTMLKQAHDSIGNREVALKIPLRSMLQDEIFTAGFMREAWIGGTVRGAGIARYIDLPPERRRSLYLVLPLYQGETLEARLNRAPPISLPDGIGIALKLCQAVRDLAGIEIIHRDIKPENIMLLEHNEVKLLDLGLAYLPGIDTAAAAKAGGTLHYMAPELLRGVPANARSEVFALGVTIYRMFSGGLYPFGQREAVPLARLRPDLPRWLGQTLQKALFADPGLRFADAGGLAAALQAGLLGGDAVAPGRAVWLTKLRVWQGLAILFGIGFAIMLQRALR